MFYRLKFFFLIIISVFILFFTAKTCVHYFTHREKPIISMLNFEQEKTVKNNFHCSIMAHNGYKIAKLAAFLDNKKIDLGGYESIKGRTFEVPLNINTTGLSDGKHVLRIEATDSSYHKNFSSSVFTFYVDNKPLRIAFFEKKYQVYQGKTLHIKLQSNKKIKILDVCFNEKNYKATPLSVSLHTYECFIPIDCEETPQELLLTAEIEDFVQNKITLTVPAKITEFRFKKQRGFSIPQEKLNNEREQSISQNILLEAMEKLKEDSPKDKKWNGPFLFPVEVQRISTPFGEVRSTPERGHHLHRGVDLISRPRCEVWASQDGRVIIMDRYYISGNTVVLDHGLGVFSLYGHLEDFASISLGEVVKKGFPIGHLGMSGYATGYHLHWEIRVHNISVDPIEWTNSIY